MPAIKFNNRGVSHLSFPITDTDTEIRIPWPDFNSFTKASFIDGDTMWAVLRGPIEREIVKIDLFNSYNGAEDKYLKVVRGQGGTGSEAWPAGTLLFLSTHADHYEALFQPDSTRQVGFNPNGVLSPNYQGEKVLQYLGCAVRWWQSFDAVNPYWQLIAGEPCLPQETYVDPGWGFKVWLDADAICWDGKSSDLFWTPDNADTVWNAGANQWETTSADKWLRLVPTGDWVDSYRSWLLRLKRPIAQKSKVSIRSINNRQILQIGNQTPLDDLYDQEIGPGGFLDDTWITVPPSIPATDIDFLQIYRDDSSGKVQLSALDFRLCDQIKIPTESGGYGDISRFDSSWIACRNLGTGENVNLSPNNGNIWAVRYSFGFYEIHRLFLSFDLEFVAMSDIQFALLRFSNAGAHTPTDRRLSLSEGLQFLPLDVSDYNNFTATLLSDDFPDADLFSNKIFTLNALGLAYIDSKIGGTAKFCLREYTKDYLGIEPTGDDNKQYTCNPPTYTADDGYPRLELYGNI